MQMSKFIDVESPIFDFLNDVADTIILGLLWVLCSLPVVTIGNAFHALRTSYRKVVLQSDGKLLPTFFGSFRYRLKQGILITAVLELVLLLFLAAIVAGDAYSPDAGWMGAVYLVIGILAFVVLTFMLWLFLSLFGKDMPAKTQFGFAYVLTIRHLPTTLMMAALLAAAVVLTEIIPIALLVLPAAFIWLTDKLLVRAENKYPVLKHAPLKKEENGANAV